MRPCTEITSAAPRAEAQVHRPGGHRGPCGSSGRRVRPAHSQIADEHRDGCCERAQVIEVLQSGPDNIVIHIDVAVHQDITETGGLAQFPCEVHVENTVVSKKLNSVSVVLRRTNPVARVRLRL